MAPAPSSPYLELGSDCICGLGSRAVGELLVERAGVDACRTGASCRTTAAPEKDRGLVAGTVSTVKDEPILEVPAGQRREVS